MLPWSHHSLFNVRYNVLCILTALCCDIPYMSWNPSHAVLTKIIRIGFLKPIAIGHLSFKRFWCFSAKEANNEVMLWSLITLIVLRVATKQRRVRLDWRCKCVLFPNHHFEIFDIVAVSILMHWSLWCSSCNKHGYIFHFCTWDK